MNLESFILGGYGIFVWPAFIFTFASCFFLYLETMKEFRKQEKIFLQEFKELQTANVKIIKQDDTEKKVFSENSVF